MKKVELFFRGEFWLHLATMFFCMVVLLFVNSKLKIELHWSFYIVISIVVGLAWEFAWKYFKQKPISLSDIVGTSVGGFLAVIIYFT